MKKLWLVSFLLISKASFSACDKPKYERILKHHQAQCEKNIVSVVDDAYFKGMKLMNPVMGVKAPEAAVKYFGNAQSLYGQAMNNVEAFCEAVSSVKTEKDCK